MSDLDDPIAAADALVAAVEPGLSTPGVTNRDVILVTGPWLAGSTSLVAALREQLPEHTFVESAELASTEAPTAALFVVSAVAPLSESDCALIDLASRHTDLVVGVVSKIDTHRQWRDVLAADRALLAARAPHYRNMPWVGVAAAPDRGDPNIDELVELLRGRLDDPDVKRRNRLRVWESRLEAVIGRYLADGAGADRQARVATLRHQRDEVRRGRRLSKSERSIALRSQLQQARVQLGYFARNRCASVRAELQEDITGLSGRRIAQFESYVRRRADEVVDEVDRGIAEHLSDVAVELGLTAPLSGTDAPPPEPDFPAPPLKSRRLETRLMMVLGAGFGLGVALAVSRLVAGVAPGLTLVGLLVGGLFGLLLTFWVVGIRGLLHDRAVLDRWVSDVTATLRSSVEELVATRVLTADMALSSEAAAVDETESDSAAEQIADIDTELREHAIATSRAAALRDRRLPPLQGALDAVREELYGPGPSRAIRQRPSNPNPSGGSL